MVIDGKNYNVTLVDLPCIVESWKTLDRILFYKSADIHQVRNRLHSSATHQLFVSSFKRALTPPLSTH